LLLCKELNKIVHQKPCPTCCKRKREHRIHLSEELYTSFSILAAHWLSDWFQTSTKFGIKTRS